MAEQLSVFIPAAGMGARLRPITSEYPKPLLLMGSGEKRLFDYPMKLVPLDSNLIISAGFGGRMLRDYLNERFGDKFPDINIVEDTNFTYNIGGTLAQHIDEVTAMLSDNVLILPADHVVTGINVENVLKTHIATSADVTIVTIRLKNYGDYLVTQSDGKVKELGSNIQSKSSRLYSSTGIYLFKTDFLMNAVGARVKLGWQGEEYDLTRNLVMPSLESNNVYAYILGEGAYWDDAGTIKRYYENNMRLSCRQSVVADSAHIGDSVVLERSVVLDDSVVLGNSELRKVIVVPNSVVFYRTRSMKDLRVLSSEGMTQI